MIQKPWGTISTRAMANRSYIDEISINAGGYSSVHRHNENKNMFVVESGALIIEIPEPVYLYTGDTLVVDQGVWHRFFCLEDAEVIEFYFSTTHGPIEVEIERREGVANGLFESNDYDAFKKATASTILLVGNGSSLLDAENGDKIDSFDRVVRFNTAKIEGYEKHVGTKTDILFIVCGSSKERLKKYNEVHVHSWQRDASKDKLFKNLSEHRECCKIDHSILKKVPIDHPSTGLIAIYTYLQLYDYVTITGFDWHEKKKHHYADEQKRGTLHKPKEEFKIIQQLIHEGKVKIL